MSTVSRKARPFSAELEADDTGCPVLRLNGTAYAVERHDRVVRLEKRDGTAYDVARQLDGHTCSCPDFTKRHAELPGTLGCKHIKGLRAVGMLEVPTPEPTAEAPVELPADQWPAWCDED